MNTTYTALKEHLITLGYDFVQGFDATPAEFFWMKDLKGSGEELDHIGYPSEMAAVAAVKNEAIEQMVVDAEQLVAGTTVILFAGSRVGCMFFMRNKKFKSVDLMFPNGQLASWIGQR